MPVVRDWINLSSPLSLADWNALEFYKAVQIKIQFSDILRSGGCKGVQCKFCPFHNLLRLYSGGQQVSDLSPSTCNFKIDLDREIISYLKGYLIGFRGRFNDVR